MGVDWFLFLGTADNQIISEIIKAHPQLKEVPYEAVEEAYKTMLKELAEVVEA